jgi:hypothetical protein
MSLTPPQMLPVCPSQSGKGELEVPALLGASKNLCHDSPQPSAAVAASHIESAVSGGDDIKQPVPVGLPSDQVAEEVVAAVIKNMFHHSPMEYIWDRILDRWVWRVTVG